MTVIDVTLTIHSTDSGGNMIRFLSNLLWNTSAEPAAAAALPTSNTEDSDTRRNVATAEPIVVVEATLVEEATIAPSSARIAPLAEGSPRPNQQQHTLSAGASKQSELPQTSASHGPGNAYFVSASSDATIRLRSNSERIRGTNNGDYQTTGVTKLSNRHVKALPAAAALPPLAQVRPLPTADPSLSARPLATQVTKGSSAGASKNAPLPKQIANSAPRAITAFHFRKALVHDLLEDLQPILNSTLEDEIQIKVALRPEQWIHMQIGQEENNEWQGQKWWQLGLAPQDNYFIDHTKDDQIPENIKIQFFIPMNISDVSTNASIQRLQAECQQTNRNTKRIKAATLVVLYDLTGERETLLNTPAPGDQMGETLFALWIEYTDAILYFNNNTDLVAKKATLAPHVFIKPSRPDLLSDRARQPAPSGILTQVKITDWYRPEKSSKAEPSMQIPNAENIESEEGRQPLTLQAYDPALVLQSLSSRRLYKKGWW